MFQPTIFGVPSVFNVTLPGNPKKLVRIARAFPTRVGVEQAFKRSWLTQGKEVANGHEVAHSKLMKDSLPAAIILNGGKETVITSADYTNQYEETTGWSYIVRVKSCYAVYIETYHVDSNLRVDVMWGSGKSPKTPSSFSYTNFTIWYDAKGKSTIRYYYGISRDHAILFAKLFKMDVDYGKSGYWPYWMNAAIGHHVLSAVEDNLSLFDPETMYFSTTSVLRYSVPRPGFVLDEPSSLLGDAPIMVPYGAYHLKALRQEAYLNALEGVRSLNDNTLANVAEIVSVIRSLVVKRQIEVPDNLASAWLSYRYQYTTTKMDAQEALSYIKRASQDLSKGFSCYGIARGKITGSVSAVVKCSMHMRSKELSTLETLCAKLYEYGLSPSSYVIWDFIPYSFIVDWFIPVGDILHSHDMDVAYNQRFDISDIWYSLTYENMVDGNIMHQYTRWNEQSTPELNGFYTIETQAHASEKVVGFRVLDSMSLLFRR